MPAPTPPRPSPAGDLPEHEEGLDARIRRAELALIARDQRVRHQLTALGERVQRARQPARWALPVIGGAALLLVGWWVTRRTRERPAERLGRAESPPRGLRGRGARGIGLLQLLALAWPMLPEPWRVRWGPNATAAMFNLGSLVGGRLARQLFGHDGQQAESPPLPPLRAVAHVDLGRYAGVWYELARLPSPLDAACSGQPELSYTVHDDRIEVCHRCPVAGGQVRVTRAEARAVPGSGGARLRISHLPSWLHWLPGAWSDYCILHIDEGYSVAVVGEPRRRGLWLLARRPRVEPETLHLLIGMARAQGFPVERLLVSQPD